MVGGDEAARNKAHELLRGRLVDVWRRGGSVVCESVRFSRIALEGFNLGSSFGITSRFKKGRVAVDPTSGERVVIVAGTRSPPFAISFKRPAM